jgi:hypothetical protein
MDVPEVNRPKIYRKNKWRTCKNLQVSSREKGYILATGVDAFADRQAKLREVHMGTSDVSIAFLPVAAALADIAPVLL